MKAKFLALAALILGMVSCQTDVVEGLHVDANGEAELTLQVGLPEATRAAGEDSALGAIGNLDLVNDWDIRYILEVYDENGVLAKERIIKREDENTETTFSLRLVPGRAYNFVVWADFIPETQAQDDYSDYHYNTANGLRKVQVKSWDVIDESRDAYTDVATVHNFSSASAMPSMTLTRPFAKLRVVTDDILEMISIRPAEVKVNYINTKFYNTFDAFTETASGVDEGPELTATLLDAQQNPVDVYTGGLDASEDIQTLFADYFFGAQDDRVMFTMDVKDNFGRDLPRITFNTNIPVGRNMLTTIYGPILTDANEITVTINPVFENGSEWDPEDDTNDLKVWDGVSIEEPAYDATTKTYTVKCGAELAWIAQEVNNGNNFKDMTVVLDRNIYLGNYEWTPIGGSGKHFAGTFDGKGFTVGDFYVTKQEGHAGLFGSARATIKNLTVNNATIVAHHYAGGIVGQGYVRMDNCHATNIDITLSAKNGDWGDKAGGLVGQNCEGGLYITNSTAKNVKIQGYRDLGGIAGMAHKGNKVTGCSVENITILQDLSVNYESSTPTTLAGVVGRRHADMGEYANNTESNVEISVIIAEGLTQNVGTEVYTATSAEGLQAMVEVVKEDSDADIVLGGDIDLSQLVLTRTAVSNWTPIGTEDKVFEGAFDGKGYTIKNLTIVETEAKEGKAYIGFFGYAKDATIKNVTFENVYINIPCLDIDHSQGHIGAVAGSLEGTSTIENVTVKGDIKVESTVTANGASRVAVVAGGNSYGNVTMKNVHVIANEGSYLKANNNVGALAGQLQGKSVFENCSSNIDVTGTKFFAGGIIGLAAGDQLFTNCHTTGNVTITAGREGRAHDHYRVGGIAGGWADGAKNVCTLVNCSYTGKLSGTNADGSVVEVFDYAGYVGRGYTLNNCQGSKVVIDGVSYVQKYNTAAEAGVYDVYDADGNTVVADGVLLKQDDGAYYISNKAGMFWFANEVNVNKNAFNGKTVKLAADIDLNNEVWTPVGQTGATTFNGVFDGQNYTISNLNVNSEAQTGEHYSSGLFGWVESHTAGHGHIMNVKINNATINGHHNCGALVGYITQETALVDNCHVTGATVSCTYANGDADGDKAGALIGNATVATPVKNCTAANSTVSAGRDAGQLIGAGKEANVTGCSATDVTVSANGTGTGANVRNEVIGRLLN